MSKQTGPLVMIAAFLMGIGLFSVFYPLFIKLFAPHAPGQVTNPICWLAASFF